MARAARAQAEPRGARFAGLRGIGQRTPEVLDKALAIQKADETRNRHPVMDLRSQIPRIPESEFQMPEIESLNKITYYLYICHAAELGTRVRLCSNFCRCQNFLAAMQLSLDATGIWNPRNLELMVRSGELSHHEDGRRNGEGSEADLARNTNRPSATDRPPGP